MLHSIQSAFGIGAPKTQSLSESEVFSSLKMDPSTRNPLIAKFGKNTEQDSLVLKALNRLTGSDNLFTRSQVYTSLSAISSAIANAHEGAQKAVQKYNEDQFSQVVDKYGNINITAILNMTPFELHFFLNIFTNFENRGNVIPIQNEMRQHCERLRSDDPELAKAIEVALEADSAYLINYLKKLGEKTADLANESIPKLSDIALRTTEELLDDTDDILASQETLASNRLERKNPSLNPLSEIVVDPDQVVSLSTGESTPLDQNDSAAPLLQKEEKASKWTSFFSRFLNLFRSDAQDSHVESKASEDKTGFWTKFKLWRLSFTAISTDDEPLGKNR